MSHVAEMLPQWNPGLRDEKLNRILNIKSDEAVSPVRSSILRTAESLFQCAQAEKRKPTTKAGPTRYVLPATS